MKTIQYSGKSTSQRFQQNVFKVWWKNNTSSQEFEKDLCVDEEIYKQVMTEPFKKIKVTGKRKDSTTPRTPLLSYPCGGLFGVVGSVNETDSNLRLKQDKTGYCSLNSVHNLVPFGDELYKFIHSKGRFFQLESIRTILNNLKRTPCQLYKLKHGGGDILKYLLSQTEGKFVVEFNGHCVSWDASKKIIIPTDSRFPHTMEITTPNLITLGISRVDMGFRVVACNQNKRKRK